MAHLVRNLTGETSPGLSRRALNAIACILIGDRQKCISHRQNKGGDMHREGNMKIEAETRVV